MSRTRRSALTMASGMTQYGIVAVTSFVATPFLLYWLGTDRFGAFRVASDWLAYVGLLEFGLGGGLQALFARTLGRDDRAGVVATIRAGSRAYCRVAVVMAVAGAGLTVALPVLTRLPGYMAGEMWTGCGLSLLAFAFLPLAPFRSLAEASQRGYLVHLHLAAQAVLAAAAAVALAAAGWGLVGQFLAVTLAGGVVYLGLAWDGVRRYPEVLGRGAAADGPSGVGGELWALSWPNLIFTLCSRLGLLTDNIVIAAFFGPALVAPFYLTQRAITLVGTQAQAVGGSTWAGLMDLHFRGEREVFARRFAQLTRITAAFGAGVLIPLAVWNRDLIALWVGPERYAGPCVTWLAAANAGVLAVLGVWGWPLIAGGLARAVLPQVLAATAVNVAVSLAATAAFGLAGPLLGTAAGFALTGWWWTLLLLRRHFGISPRLLLSAAAGPALVAAPYAAGLILLAHAVPAYDPAWPRWVGLLAVGGWLALASSTYWLLAWFLAFPRQDREEWVGRFRAWRPRLSRPTIATAPPFLAREALARGDKD